jgi:hypothetical protein
MPESAVFPTSVAERERRGFCLCPILARRDQQQDADRPCRVHPEGRDLTEAQRIAEQRLFFDDRRQRFVTWPDAVEAMRQGRYAGAANLALTVFTWANLVRLLEALRDPLGTPETSLTETYADALIAWAGEAVPLEDRRSLLILARGGTTDAVCHLFRMAARTGRALAAPTADRNAAS